MNLKKQTSFKWSSFVGSALLGAIGSVNAQYAPPPAPAPFTGFLNEYLRRSDTNFLAWDFGGSERLRFEDHEGYTIAGAPGTPAKPNNDFRAGGADVYNSYLLSRLRFHASYNASWWGIYLEGQSSMVAGDDRFAYFASPAPAGTAPRWGDGPESDKIDLHQAYLTLGNPKEFPVSLKVGRQILAYGDERLVGAFDWNNIARAFDAVKLRWQSDWAAVDVFSSHPVVPEDDRFDADNDHDWFSGVYASSTKIPKTILDLYFLARNSSTSALADEPSPQFPQPSARDIYTAGGRVKSKAGELAGFDYTVEGAYQFGNFRDTRAGAPTTRVNQDAFMAVILGGYTFTEVWAKPRIGLEFDYGSGDGNVHDGTHGTFENLFPTNHKFYGSMDFVSLQNIQDAGINLTIKPHPRLSFALMGNFLWLADTHDNFYAANGAPRGGAAASPGTGFGINPQYNNYVGAELTAIAGWAVSRFAQLEAGYGHFFHGHYLSSTWSAPSFGARDADFAYAQLNFNF